MHYSCKNHAQFKQINNIPTVFNAYINHFSSEKIKSKCFVFALFLLCQPQIADENIQARGRCIHKAKALNPSRA